MGSLCTVPWLCPGEHHGEPCWPCPGSCGCSVTLPQPSLPGAGCEQLVPIFALCFWVRFWFCSPSRGQVTVAGTSLSCRTWGRRALGGSALLQRRREPRVLQSSPATLWWWYTWRVFQMPPACGLLFNSPAGNKLHFLGEGKPGKRKKREKEKRKKPRLLKLQKWP